MNIQLPLYTMKRREFLTVRHRKRNPENPDQAGFCIRCGEWVFQLESPGSYAFGQSKYVCMNCVDEMIDLMWIVHHESKTKEQT